MSDDIYIQDTADCPPIPVGRVTEDGRVEIPDIPPIIAGTGIRAGQMVYVAADGKAYPSAPEYDEDGLRKALDELRLAPTTGHPTRPAPSGSAPRP